MHLRLLELGSNSFQLHGFHVSREEGVRALWGQKRGVPLAAGVDERGYLLPEVRDRAVDAVGSLLGSVLSDWPLCAFATSLVREAPNRRFLLDHLERTFGLRVRSLTGTQEALLSYQGVRSTLQRSWQRLAVIDIGGGSTQLALGDASGVRLTRSAPLGTLRARQLGVAEIKVGIDAWLGTALSQVREARPDTVVFVGGAARALQCYLASLGQLECSAAIRLETVERLLPHARAATASDLVERGLTAGRHLTFAAGTTLIAQIAQELGIDRFFVSRGGVREGLVLQECERRRRAVNAQNNRVRAAAHSPYSSANGSSWVNPAA